MFIQNDGQFGEGARFQVRGGDHTLWLADDGLWVTVLEKPSSPLPARPSSTPPPEFGGAGDEGLPRQGVHLKLTFPGANPHPRLEPFDRLETSVNYFIGNDPAQWRTDVPVYAGVRYRDLYPGVDLEITGEGGRWTWRLACRANCQFALRAVRLRVEGADDVEWLPGGAGLRLTTALGDFTLPLLAVERLNVERANVERINAQTLGITAPLLPSPPAPRLLRPERPPLRHLPGGKCV